MSEIYKIGVEQSIDWNEFNEALKPGYYSGWSAEWPGFFYVENIKTHELPNRFRRWMYSLCFGVRWRQAIDDGRN